MVIERNYCTMCDDDLTVNKFWQSESIVNANGKLHICSDCINALFIRLYIKERGLPEDFTVDNNTLIFDATTEYILKETCRYIDLQYSRAAYEAFKTHVSVSSSNDRKINKLFGVYKSKLSSTSKRNSIGSINYSQTFENSDEILHEEIVTKRDSVNIMSADELFENEMFWGKGFSVEDYIFLEVELNGWKRTHKCDNQAELTLLKEICIKVLSIRKRRENNGDVSVLQKTLQDLMKTASVDPAKSNIADSGKSLDSYGLWVEDIEQYEPAEFFEDKKMFKDFDGIKSYTDKYILRPLKNLLTGSRDFNIDDDLEDGDV